MFYENYQQLGYAIALQAAKDYATSSPAKRRYIIRQLRSHYMEFITNGLSLHLAEALRKDYKAVIKRIRNMEADVV